MVNKKTDKKRPQVEVIPGVEVSKVLIDEAVRATSDPARATLVDETRERAKTQKVLHDYELREDIDVSKKVVKAIYDQVGKPEPRRIDVDTLPPFLKRTVVAYVNMCEARDEYAEALRELSSKASVDAMPAEVVAACKAIDVDPERLVAGLRCVDPRDVRP